MGILALAGCAPFSERTTLNGGRVGVEYSDSISAGSGDMFYDLDYESSLPKGLTLWGDGAITGIPMEAGTFEFTAVAINSKDEEFTADFSMTIEGAELSYSASALPDATTGEPYMQDLGTATGMPEITYALKEGSALPAGLTLAEDGVLSGRPTQAAEAASFTIVASASGCDPVEATFTLRILQGEIIDETLGYIKFEDFTLPEGLVGEEYSQDIFKAQGVPGITYSVRFTSGKGLPAGLRYDSELGLISGTPTDSTHGPITFRVTARAEGYDSVTVMVTLDVKDVYVATGKLEAEYIYVNDLSGAGYSSAPSGTGLIQSATNASNGYFLVSALDPETQGTGGGSSAFSYDQNAAVNLRPAEQGSVATPMMYCTDGFGIKQERATRLDPVTFTGGFFNHGAAPCQITLGIKVVDAEGNATYLRSDYTNTLRMLTGYSEFTMTLNDFPQEEGDYTIYPAYYDEDEGAWHDMRTSIREGKTHILANATSTEITFASPQGYADGLQATDVTLLYTAYAGKTFMAKATISNSGNEFFSEVFAAVVGQGGVDIMGNSNQTLIDVTKDSPTEVEFSITAPQSAGNYELVIATADGTIISDRYAFTVEEAPAGALSLSITSPLRIADADNVTADNITATADITCNSGYYGGTLYLFFFNETGGSSISSLTTDLYIGAGETKQVKFTGMMAGAEEGATYVAAMYYIDGNYIRPVSNSYNNQASFTVGSLTPIEGIAEGNAQPQEVCVYTLTGVCVMRRQATEADLSGLAPGTYIVRTGGTTKKVTVN